MDIKKTIGEISKSLSNLGGLGANDAKVNKSTESEIALAFAGAFSSLPFRRGEGGLFYYETGRYVKVLDEETGCDSIPQIILGAMMELHIGGLYQVNSVNLIIKRIVNDPRIPNFKPSKSIISFRNCCLNIKTMHTHAHSPEFMTRTFFDFDYDPSARCNLWEQFLTDMLRDDGSRLILQEFLGMMFIDPSEFKEAKACFLYGTGANGKSVVSDTICDMLGRENCSHYSLQQLCTASDSAYYLAKANGKLLNYAQDMGNKDFSGGIWKTIAAREPVEARPIGQAPFTANDMPVLMANINKIPQTTDSTEGHWRRFIILYFDVTIAPEKQDKTYPTKIRQEISGIFNWILRGRERLLKNDGKFSDSKLMTDMIKRAKTDSNSVLSFLESKGYVGEGGAPGRKVESMRLPSIRLMGEYKAYCSSWGNIPKSKPNFFSDLKQAKFLYNDNLRFEGSKTSGFEFYKIDNIYGSEIGEDGDGSENEHLLSSKKEEDNTLPF